jgi:hypothetical protein
MRRSLDRVADSLDRVLHPPHRAANQIDRPRQSVHRPPHPGHRMSQTHEVSRTLRLFLPAAIKQRRPRADVGDMPIVPENTTPRINWYRAHIGKWIENAGALGLTSEQLDALDDAITAAAQKQAAQIATQQAARTATASLKAAMEKLSQLGGKAMVQIKATAANQGDEAYSLALVPRPQQPAPISEPGMPTRFRISLNAVGWIDLSWKCKNPRGSSGTMYEVERRIAGQHNDQFVFLGTVGKKKFLDDTIPPGTPSALYRVTAIRSTRRGKSAVFPIHLGSIARNVDFAAPRMAA